MWVAGFGNSPSSPDKFTESLSWDGQFIQQHRARLHMNKTSVCTVRPKTDRGTSRTSNTTRRVNMKPRRDLIFSLFSSQIVLDTEKRLQAATSTITEWTVLTDTTNYSPAWFETDASVQRVTWSKSSDWWPRNRTQYTVIKPVYFQV